MRWDRKEKVVLEASGCISHHACLCLMSFVLFFFFPNWYFPSCRLVICVFFLCFGRCRTHPSVVVWLSVRWARSRTNHTQLAKPCDQRGVASQKKSTRERGTIKEKYIRAHTHTQLNKRDAEHNCSVTVFSRSGTRRLLLPIPANGHWCGDVNPAHCSVDVVIH